MMTNEQPLIWAGHHAHTAELMADQDSVTDDARAITHAILALAHITAIAHGIGDEYVQAVNAGWREP